MIERNLAWRGIRMGKTNGYPQIRRPADEREEGERRHAVEQLKESLAHHRAARASSPALQKACDHFVVLYHPLIADVVRRHRLGAMDADDCVQEICTRLIEKRTPLRHRSGLAPFDCWLSLVIHRNLVTLAAARRTREDRVRPLRHETGDPAESRTMSAEAAAELTDARDRLASVVRRTLSEASESHRRILDLHYRGGSSIEDVCDQLRVTPAAVRSCCRRAADSFHVLALRDSELEPLLRRLSWSARRIFRNSVMIADNSAGQNGILSIE